MNIEKTAERMPVITAGTILLIFVFFINNEPVQANQQNSEELLLKIMDLHGELVDNEMFLAQAKLLGAYVEAAQPMNEKGKVAIYTKVLSILAKIKLAPIEISTDSSDSQVSTETQSTKKGKEETKSVYEPGAAILEIFKADSFETIPALPVIRTYWNRELAFTGGFLIPGRALEIGREGRYIARFSFYYEAKKPGRYSFAVVHDDISSCKLKIGGVEIFKSSGRLEAKNRGRDSLAAQGVCKLEKGFHRIEFFLFSEIYENYQAEHEGSQGYSSYYTGATLQLKVLSPDGFDAVTITKDMMLLKKQ